MANFMGGSAPAMAGQVADGFILMNPSTIKSYSPADLNTLKAELEKLQRDARAQVPPQDDAPANQARNRRISRITSAIVVVTQQLSVRR
jgi:hypothetical protein